MEIEIYTREPYEYYARIRLPEVFESPLSGEDLQIYNPEWYSSKNISVFKNQERSASTAPAIASR